MQVETLSQINLVFVEAILIVVKANENENFFKDKRPSTVVIFNLYYLVNGIKITVEIIPNVIIFQKDVAELNKEDNLDYDLRKID